MTQFNIVILGGGTAGWLAANHLGKVLKGRDDVTLSLIESPDIPTIGVGEGTVPAIRQSLRAFGIRETDFIRHADVTFKQSIRFNNWLCREKHGADNYYHHLFDKPNPLGMDLTPLWLSNRNQHYAELVSPQHKVCESLKAPKSITDPEYQGQLGYAYHLNALKFAELLADNATQRFNVEHIRTKVLGVNLDNKGFIESLATNSMGELAFDFYIDCSGLACELLGKALNVPFKDVSDILLVNQALALQVPTQPGQPIPPYTIATAHQAGWIWDIALSSRRGTGFVYSDRHMTEAEASRKYAHYLGIREEQADFRRISMRCGYRESAWHKNCVALGLAQGFLEPLEATSIMLTDFASDLLSKRLPKERQEMSLLSKRFNRVMNVAWERVVDFIKLHYWLSDRNDSEFWRDNKDPKGMSMELTERIRLWQSSVPLASDFETKFEVFDLDNYLYVLYGMQFGTETDIGPSGDLSGYAQQIAGFADSLSQDLPEHRSLLEKIKRYGLQRV